MKKYLRPCLKKDHGFWVSFTRNIFGISGRFITGCYLWGAHTAETRPLRLYQVIHGNFGGTFRSLLHVLRDGGGTAFVFWRDGKLLILIARNLDFPFIRGWFWQRTWQLALIDKANASKFCRFIRILRRICQIISNFTSITVFTQILLEFRNGYYSQRALFTEISNSFYSRA